MMKAPEKLNAPTVITAHNNADFDALAAIIAASKLYSNATLVFPGSQEKNLRTFYIETATYFFNFRSARDIDFDSVELLVIVDTRQRSRLTHVGAILDKPGLEVHAYDHHPDTDDDVPYSQGIVLPWGATTSIIIKEIRKQNTTLSENEATILGCGIYEDTGSFTYNSTTEHDFEAAAWLKTQGMDLTVITDLLHRDLNAEQIAILNTLLESASTHEINGVPIIVAEVSLEHYVGDFALLAHKLLDMQNIRTLFVLGRMQDRIHLVARSRTPDVDVGQICSSLGGGGHAFAASATIKDRTLSQVKDELFALLYTHINPQMLVRDLMSAPAVTVETTDTIANVVEIFTRYGFKAIPVVEPETKRCAGVLDHALAIKALSHNLGDVAVGEYMFRECSVINPGSDLYPVIEIIIGQRQHLAPVVEDGEVAGVITRTDLINTLIEEPARIPETFLPDRSRERFIKTLLYERLPDAHYQLLIVAGELAQEMNYQAYVVGGFVRDILLRRKNLDIDLVIEGDGILFAKALSKKLEGRVRSHHKFKTAVIIYPSLTNGKERHIDVATARLEYYEYPAALPTVELSSIKMDLFRRDFTVNALAVQLNPGNFGRLVDFFGAQRDIKDRTIRVIHSLSFVEDPTRILRAIRFEQRYNFQIGGQTKRLIKNAIQLQLIEKLSGSRLFQELKYITEEKNPLDCFRSMQNYNLLTAIYPTLEITRSVELVLEEIEKVLNWYRLLYLEPQASPWIVYFMGLTSGWSRHETENLMQRLIVSKRVEQDFIHTREQVIDVKEKLMYWSVKQDSLSELYFLLEPVCVEGLLFLMAKIQHEHVRKHISLYLTTLKSITLNISGKDLIAMGFDPSPLFGEVLKQTLAAKIDEKAPTLLTQLATAEKLMKDFLEKSHTKSEV